jgi:hypothetical protein
MLAFRIPSIKARQFAIAATRALEIVPASDPFNLAVITAHCDCRPRFAGSKVSEVFVIIHSEFLHFPASAVFLGAGFHGQKSEWKKERRNFDFDFGIIAPPAFDLVTLDYAIGAHHHEIRSVKGSIGEPELESLKAVPLNCAGEFFVTKMVRIGLLGRVHVAGWHPPEREEVGLWPKWRIANVRSIWLPWYAAAPEVVDVIFFGPAHG